MNGMEHFEYFKGLATTNARIDGLVADFSGMEKLWEVVNKTLRRLSLKENVQNRVSMVKSGSLDKASFDGWFAEVVRIELGKTLGIVRNKAKEKAAMAGAGSASSAVLRRMYRDEYKGAVHNLGSRKRISSRTRIEPEPDGGKSGIRRSRMVSDRTKKLRGYYGPDRSFILRFLDSGTDIRMAKTSGPTGNRSRATWGRRGSITGKGFFHTLQSDMEQAAQELGQTLIGHVENWLETQFSET